MDENEYQNDIQISPSRTGHSFINHKMSSANRLSSYSNPYKLLFIAFVTMSRHETMDNLSLILYSLHSFQVLFMRK